MPMKSPSYEPLLSKDDPDGDGEHNNHDGHFHTPPRTRLFAKRASVPLWILVAFAVVQIISLTLLARNGVQHRCNYPNAQILYTPAQEAVEYEAVKFRSGLNGEPDDIYSSPPSPEVDAAWQDLFGFGITELSQGQADQLVNATWQIPHSDSKYIMLLDVFHELHCLNKIRMSLYSDYYYPDSDPKEEAMRRLHVKHCLGSIRQSLQCSSDISTIVWYKAEGEREIPRFDILHSCRNFDKVKDWARDHRGSIFVKNGRVSAIPSGFSDEMP